MPLNNPRPGPGDTPEYVASGIPWVTSSVVPANTIVEYEFPYVTRFFVVRNTDTPGASELAVGFTELGLASSSNYFTVAGGELDVRLELRVKSLFFSASQGTPSLNLIVGLTRIPERMFPTITGSFDSTGSFEGVG
jgi:hypothetical protein